MKKIVAAIAAVILLAYSVPYVHEYFNSVSTQGNPVTITVPQGATADDIAKILKENDIINHEMVFKLRVRLSKYNGKLNYGTYTLDDGMCIKDIIKTLSNPTIQDSVSLVVPEGFSAERIAKRVEEMGICSESEFLDAMDDEYELSFLSLIPEGKYKYALQGFLFPETYSFHSSASAHDIIYTMLCEFEKRYTQEVGAIDSNIFEIVTKASLVEKEAMLAKERPLIAGVIENRLKADMPLQIDAAIVYAISDGMYDVDTVLYRDLETDSPYNIYKNKGLPAGPICNPGMSALKAAKNPQASSYLYYHTDTEKNDGSHIFTETYDQHLNTMGK